MGAKYVSSFCIMDFETGGLKSQKNPITEVAMLAITGDSLEEICRYEAYAKHQYNPTLEYEKKALDITGIQIEDLIELGIPIKDLVDGIIATLEKANEKCQGSYQKTILVGHNFGFDVSFLQAIFGYCKKDLSKYVAGKKDHFENFQPDYVDTVNVAKMKWQDDEQMENFKLITTVEKAGLELSDAHRAINDVVANKELFVTFINDLRTDNIAVTAASKGRFRDHFQY